jgi:hypothetical protein
MDLLLGQVLSNESVLRATRGSMRDTAARDERAPRERGMDGLLDFSSSEDA